MARDVEAWFEKLPDQWRDRAQRIRELILEAAPGMKEEWMFESAIFYKHHGWLIYLAMQKVGLVVGFCNGVHMTDPEGLFARTEHTQVRHYLPPPTGRLSETALRHLIDEALRVNAAIAEERRMRKKAKRRQR
jgi:hypothetical protein